MKTWILITLLFLFESSYYYKSKTSRMKKSPVMVIVRMRPTSNFAYKNMQVDEETGYQSPKLEKSIFM